MAGATKLMTSLQGIVFDYGCVLSEPQLDSDHEVLADQMKIPVDLFTTLYWRHRPEYDAWTIDSTTYWQRVAKDAQVTIAVEHIERLVEVDLESWARPNQTMVRWAQKLSTAGYRVGLLSNMSLALKDYLCTQDSWLPVFHHSTYSCDVNLIKPDRAIYDHCIGGMNLAPQQLLFLDDKEENIAAARAAGMQAEVFQSLNDLPMIIEKFDLPML